MQIYQHMTVVCVGTHRLLQILNYATLATLHAVSLCLAAILFPTPTPMLLTRTGYPTGEFQNLSTERHAPRETTATHAHRSLHHVTSPQVDKRANTPLTSDATTPPLFRAPPTGDSLAHASLNVGGPEITPNRLCHLLNGFTTAPHTISLQEFKPTTKHHIKEYERVAMFWKYHLLYSAFTTKNGVALLVHTSISLAPRTLTIHSRAC